MGDELEAISGISDVSYLLTRLKLASKKNETEMKEAIVGRLREIGVLRDGQDREDISFANLRSAVERILGGGHS